MTRDLFKLFYEDKRPVFTYGFAIIVTLLTTWIHLLLPFGRQSPYLLAIIPLILSTIFGGKGPGMLALFTKILLINFYLLPPYGFININLLILEQAFIFLLEGFLIIWLVESQKHIKEENLRQKVNQKLLNKAGRVLFYSLDYKKTLNNLAFMIVPSMADWCTVDLLDKKGKLHQEVIAHADPKKVDWAKSIQKRYSYLQETGDGASEVIRTKKSKLYPYISSTLLHHSIKNKEYLEIIKSMGLRSLMIVPILSGDKAIGTISFVSSSSGKSYDQVDQKFAEDLGRRAGQAIENSKLYLLAKEEIEERKEAEKKLEEAKEQLEVILKNITDGITVQDRVGKLIFVNDAAARLAGFTSSKEMIEAFNSPKAIEKYLARYEMRDKDGNPVISERLPNRLVWKGEKKPEAIIQYYDKLSGTTRWSLTRSRPVVDEKGETHFAVTIITDISKEKEIERKKDEFISIASHELKTPLTSIKAYTQILKLKLAAVLNKKFSSYLDRMDSQIDRLVKLVSELLDVSKIQSGKLALNMEIFDFRALINEIVDTMRLTTANHKFIVQGEKKIPVTADRSRLEQVVNNLLVNAIKFSPKGGEINISISVQNRKLIVKIKDSGMGIAKEEQEEIFSRFNQSQAKKKEGLSGLGLGLYISSEIVKRHQGNISVESEPEKGSTFSFTIPTHIK